MRQVSEMVLIVAAVIKNQELCVVFKPLLDQYVIQSNAIYTSGI